MPTFLHGKNTRVIFANPSVYEFATSGITGHNAQWTAGSPIVKINGVYDHDNTSVTDTLLLIGIGSRVYGVGLTNGGNDFPVYVVDVKGNTVFLSAPADITNSDGDFYTNSVDYANSYFPSGQSNDVSQFFNDVGVSRMTEPQETTTFQTGAAKSYISGIRDGSLTLSGFYDGSLDGVDAILQAATYTSTSGSQDPGFGISSTQGQTLLQGVAVFPDGGDTGGKSVCYLSKGIVTKHDLKSPVSGVVAVDTEIQSSHGVWRGYGQVASYRYVDGTPDGLGQVSFNTATVDHGADSSEGGLAIIGITSSTGGYFTDVDGNYGNAGNQYPPVYLQLMASADGSSWIGLTNLWSDQAGQIVDLTGTIYRYTRLAVTLYPSDSPNPPSTATVYYGLARY
jgi:hypothetical protein